MSETLSGAYMHSCLRGTGWHDASNAPKHREQEAGIVAQSSTGTTTVLIA